MPRASLLLIVVLSSCVRTIGAGPDVGACADYPAGVYTYGQIGIGTCLAGPADMAFIPTNDGRLLLGVANADPYQTFDSGSVLLVDTASIDLTKGKNTLDQVDAIGMIANKYPAGLGWVADRDLLLATGRFSEGAATTSARDHVAVYDLSDSQAPVPWSDGPEITVEDDPVFVQTDATRHLAFVTNITDHSVTVLDTSSSPIIPIDIAPDAHVTPAVSAHVPTSGFGLAPGGSSYDLDGSTIIDATLIPTDTWTMTWVEGTYRLWTSTPDSDGLARWSSGGGDFTRVGTADELVPDEIAGMSSMRDPFAGLISGGLAMYYSDGGVLKSIQWDAGTDAWAPSTITTRVTGHAGTWNAFIGGATALSQDGNATYYYEGRASATGTPAIGRTGVEDNYRASGDPIVVAPEGSDGVGQPDVGIDDITRTIRMWLGVHSAAGWRLAIAESANGGATFDAPEDLVGLPSDVAAPVVTWASGRYLMWASRDDAGGTTIIQGWSYDGVHWYDVHDAIQTGRPWDESEPYRVALQADPTGKFRLEGTDLGLISGLASGGGHDLVASALGFSIRVTQGAEVQPPDGVAVNGLVPGAFATIDGEDVLFATAYDADLRAHIVELVQTAGGWDLLADDLVADGDGGNVGGVESPVVVEQDGGFAMYYAAAETDGAWRIHRATSPDGSVWDADPHAMFASATGWDGVEQRPHSVEALEDGRVRLWYGGSNGSRTRIGSAIGDGATLAPEAGTADDWQFDLGQPGEFDDSGVGDPLVVTTSSGRELWYTGNDGVVSHIGHAVDVDGVWKRRADGLTRGTIAVMSGLPDSFSEGGVSAPILGPRADAGSIWFAGYDGTEQRVGRSIIGETAGPDGRAAVLYPTPRFPSAGDTLQFSTVRGDEGPSVIELAQFVDGITAKGLAVDGATYDQARGFLYLTSKLTNYIYVVDVRDDSAGDFVDRNAFDIEALILVNTATGPHGFRDATVVGDRLYVDSYAPDALWAIDLTKVVDDDRKQVVHDAVIGALPLALSTQDAGVPSYTGTSGVHLGGGDMDLSPDGRYLWVPQYADNSVSVFDLELGEMGQEIARIPFIGEGPHQVRITPDGRYAYVANYLGEVNDNEVSPTIAIIDADPTSPTFLTPLTWLGNRP